MHSTTPHILQLQAGASWLSTCQACRNGIRLCHARDLCLSSLITSHPTCPHPAPTVQPVGRGVSTLLKLILNHTPFENRIGAAYSRPCGLGLVPISTVARRFCTMGHPGLHVGSEPNLCFWPPRACSTLSLSTPAVPVAVNALRG